MFALMLVMSFSLVTATPVHAATKTASVTGNWNTTATWGGSAVPTSADDVIINSGITVTVNVALAECASITFNAPAAAGGITISGTNELRVSGAIIMNAATAAFTTTLAVGEGTLNAGSITISGANTETFVNRITVYKGIINCTGNFTFNSGNKVESAVLETTDAIATLTVGGNFTCGLGNGTFKPKSEQIMSLGGNWDFSGTLSNDNRLVLTLNGSGAQTVAGSGGYNQNAFRSFIVDKASGTATLGANIFPRDGDLTVSNGTLDLSVYTANQDHPTKGTLSVADGATLRIGGTNGLPSGYATHTFGATSTVEFYGTAQTVNDAASLVTDTFGNLTLSTSDAKTLSMNTAVNGKLSMQGTATLALAGKTLTYGASATLEYNTATGRTAGAEWITPFAATGGVVIANTGTITLNAAKVFNASVPLTINSGATLAMSTYLLTLNGNLVNNGGTTSGSGGVTIAGTATQSIGAFTNTGTVSMTKTAGTATLTGAMSAGPLTMNGVGGTLNLGTGLTHTVTNVTLTNGTLDGGSSTLNVSGTWTGTSGFTAGTGTIKYNGSAQAIAAVTYNSLTINQSSGDATLGGAATVNGTLTLTAGNLAVTEPNELTMGASATTTGATDVTGIVKRTTLVAATSYTFGNQYTTINFQNVGTLPTDMSIKITLSAPAWKTGAVTRTYDII